jgi:hypothetical protein
VTTTSSIRTLTRVPSTNGLAQSLRSANCGVHRGESRVDDTFENAEAIQTGRKTAGPRSPSEASIAESANASRGHCVPRSVGGGRARGLGGPGAGVAGGRSVGGGRARGLGGPGAGVAGFLVIARGARRRRRPSSRIGRRLIASGRRGLRGRRSRIGRRLIASGRRGLRGPGARVGDVWVLLGGACVGAAPTPAEGRCILRRRRSGCLRSISW